MYKNILPEEDSEEEEDEEETRQEEDQETDNEEERDQDESEPDQETEPPKLQNLVTALPDIRIHHTKKDKIKAILICCDGVTDVLKPDQIRSSYIEGKGSSAIVVRKAFANKSLDNISACCVNIIWKIKELNFFVHDFCEKYFFEILEKKYFLVMKCDDRDFWFRCAP